MELSKKGKISETNLSGVTYTMEELVNWDETYSGTDNDNLQTEWRDRLPETRRKLLLLLYE